MNSRITVAGEATPTAFVAGSEWQANLALTVARRASGSRLWRSSHSGPLYVQKPFYPEGPELAHIYLLHPPGGLVSGDRLSIDVDVGMNAAALLTTPGAARVYGARRDRRRQIQHSTLRVAAGASLEWLPLETIAYSGGNGEVSTRVELEGDARYLGWDITCLGLPAADKPFVSGSLTQSLWIEREGEVLLRDRLQIDGENHALLRARAGLQGRSVHGLFVAGPLPAALNRNELMTELRATLGATADTAVTCTGAFLVARHLGDSAEQGRRRFISLWRILRPHLLHRAAVLPRIWAT